MLLLLLLLLLPGLQAPFRGARVLSEVLVCPDVWRSSFLLRPVFPSDRSLRRSLTRSFARSAWAQTSISVSWRTHEMVYRVGGTFTRDLPDSSHPKNLASPQILLFLQTNLSSFETT